MKTTLLCTIVFALAVLNAVAQNSIPNGDFENWNSSSYKTPSGYAYSSNQAGVLAQLPFNCVQTTDSYHGTYAVKLTTEISMGDTLFGYFINSNPNGNPQQWHGGIPYAQKPTGIKGYYKSAIPVGDTALIIVAFSKNAVNIGSYVFKFYGTHSTYTPFSFTFNPAVSQTPDSIIFGATSSDVLSGYALNGSMFQIDSISFTGAASQPALFNGDFESWQTTTVTLPSNWYLQNGVTNSITQTTDAENGTYAIELKTIAGNNNGVPSAQPSSITNGYYAINCKSNCTELGGYPFSNQVDTLVLYYKYAPSGNDSAQVYVNFKKSGVQISGFTKNLGASSSYKYVAIPFDAGQTPDTVIVQVQSSLWQNSALSYVGSDLKIDNMYFKSQQSITTGTTSGTVVDNAVSVYPNPNNGSFTVKTDFSNTTIDIINVIGQVVYSQNLNAGISQININGQTKGMYQYVVRGGSQTLGTGKIIIE